MQINDAIVILVHSSILIKFIFYSVCRDKELASNRGNYLLIHLLKTRFPNILQTEQVDRITKMLSQPLEKCKIHPPFFSLRC